MKKRVITATVFVACLAMCAAVWPQNEPTEETPEVPTPPAVTTAQPEVPKIPEIEERIIPEKETVDVAELEPVDEVAAAPAPELIPAQAAPSSEVQVLPEQNAVPQQEPEPTLTSPDRAPDNMVYVPGFGWLESQGPNHAEYAEDMYENGNKIGRMN